MREEWKPIFDWEETHDVSSLGRVRSKSRIGTIGRILKLNLATGGYPTVTLSGGGKKKSVYVHHLVAIVFIGHPPGKIGVKRGCFTINHKDGDKANNKPSNLEWITAHENFIHAVKTGLFVAPKGSKVYNAKLTETQVVEIRNLLSQGLTQKEVGLLFKVGKTNINMIANRKTWKHI